MSSVLISDNNFDTVRTEIGEMLNKLKYHQDKSQIPLIAEILIEFLKTRLVTPYISAIIPVPPSDTKRLFQPVYEIAKIVGEKLRIKVDFDYLLKIKSTEQLKNVDDIDERRKILSDVFQIKDPNRYLGKKVLLFDDIYRSGETMNAVAKMFNNIGHVDNVYVLTITKTRSNR